MSLASDVVLDTLRGVLRERGQVSLPAAGYSMGPTFRAADSLIIRAIPAGVALPPGRIVIFERQGHWVAHRLWLKWGAYCLTGGDAVGTLDWPPPHRSTIEGVVSGLLINGMPVDLDARQDLWGRLPWIGRGLFRLFKTLVKRCLFGLKDVD